MRGRAHPLEQGTPDILVTMVMRAYAHHLELNARIRMVIEGQYDLQLKMREYAMNTFSGAEYSDRAFL